jgi:6-phosphofructokinase 1
MGKRIGVLTSGGDAPGMNACIRAVVKSSIAQGATVFGIEDGFQGLIEGRIIELTYQHVNNIIHLGGTILGSARSSEFLSIEGRKRAIANCVLNKLDALIVIGGDGTYKGALALSNESSIPVIGIPGTIDNDIASTEITIGFDTCLNTVINAVDKIRDTATSHHRIFFVEVMGRNSGKIAYHAAIASGADHVLIPETKTNIKALANDLAQSKGSRSTIVIVAEGDDEGDGQQILSEIKTFLPEFDLKYTKLGHVQRGGSPSVNDRILATRMGDYAVSLLHLGVFNKIIGMNSGFLTTVDLASLDNIINSNHQESIQLLDRLLTRH